MFCFLSCIFRKIRVFSVFSHRPGAMLFTDVIFATMDYWKFPAAILVIGRRSGNRRLRFLSWQEHLFPHCFGTFFISSFPFHFVLSENNLTIILTWLLEKMVNAHICSASLWTASEFSAEITQRTIQKLTLRQLEVTRLTHMPPKTQKWAYSGLENKQTANMARNIYDQLKCFYFIFSMLKI